MESHWTIEFASIYDDSKCRGYLMSRKSRFELCDFGIKGVGKIYWKRDRSAGIFRAQKKSTPRDFSKQNKSPPRDLFKQKNSVPRDFLIRKNFAPCDFFVQKNSVPRDLRMLKKVYAP